MTKYNDVIVVCEQCNYPHFTKQPNEFISKNIGNNIKCSNCKYSGIFLLNNNINTKLNNKIVYTISKPEDQNDNKFDETLSLASGNLTRNEPQHSENILTHYLQKIINKIKPALNWNSSLAYTICGTIIGSLIVLIILQLLNNSDIGANSLAIKDNTDLLNAHKVDIQFNEKQLELISENIKKLQEIVTAQSEHINNISDIKDRLIRLNESYQIIDNNLNILRIVTLKNIKNFNKDWKCYYDLFETKNPLNFDEMLKIMQHYDKSLSKYQEQGELYEKEAVVDAFISELNQKWNYGITDRSKFAINLFNFSYQEFYDHYNGGTGMGIGGDDL